MPAPAPGDVELAKQVKQLDAELHAAAGEAVATAPDLLLVAAGELEQPQCQQLRRLPVDRGCGSRGASRSSTEHLSFVKHP